MGSRAFTRFQCKLALDKIYYKFRLKPIHLTYSQIGLKPDAIEKLQFFTIDNI
ncbi:hypothetical protein SAMN05421765_1166 [Kaistella antarctica]|uniref:Uncharacterized protein n=1 Tax=Kaistella antarctica TaxID=266748 RepID=A0A3S4W045_9FLAO|nr:hypothetical protein SAMN05421765_1166 [Kaistella antarctica]VEH94907.1 Uncharacterised protein [Kaistella antarctica]